MRIAVLLALVILSHASSRAAAQTTATSAPPSSLGPSRSTATTPLTLTNAVGGLVSFTSGMRMHFGSDERAVASGEGWRGGVLLDDSVRDGLRLRSEGGRELAARISDITLSAVLVKAAVVDALLVPTLRGDLERAWQASLAHTMALGLTLTLGSSVKAAVGRARPYEQECDVSSTAEECHDPDRFHSFYSGHSSMAFASAGFSCAMSLSRSVYGDAAGDVTSCGASLALASTTAVLRIAADRHYLSDVLVGAVIGFVVGYLVPLAIVPDGPSRLAGAADEPPDVDLDPGLTELPSTPGWSWSLAPMLSPPSLETGADTVRASGGQSTQSTGNVSGVGGTVGLSMLGAF